MIKLDKLNDNNEYVGTYVVCLIKIWNNYLLDKAYKYYLKMVSQIKGGKAIFFNYYIEVYNLPNCTYIYIYIYMYLYL